MKLSSREMALAGITLAIVLIGGTIWLGAPLLSEWRSFQQKQKEFKQRIKLSGRLLKQEDEVNTRLAELQVNMKRYPYATQVTSQLIGDLLQSGKKAGLAVSNFKDRDEVQVGELYEMTISFSWQGSDKALVDFLYEVQNRGAMVDISELTAGPVKAGSDQLKGVCKIDYAYSRHASDEAPTP